MLFNVVRPVQASKSPWDQTEKNGNMFFAFVTLLGLI